MHLAKKLSKGNRTVLVLTSIFLLLCGAAFMLLRERDSFTPPPLEHAGEQSAVALTYDERSKELLETITTESDMQVRSEAYRNLLEHVGAEKGQEMLYRSGLPFNGESHLLNHTAGEFIYEHYGAEGITKCKLYFLASCYHAQIIATISYEGREALAGIMETCRETGGRPLAAQCAHGIGHGALAWVGYANLEIAPKFCDELKENNPDFPYFNCLDGVFMENVWGVHSGAPHPDRWVSETDPLYPCNDPRIKEKYLPGCYSNQASLMYRMFEGDVSKVSDVCLSVANDEYRRICFDGLARQIHPVARGDVRETERLCGKVDENWQSYCIATIASSEFSVGGRSLPFELCSRQTGETKNECFESLSQTISVYSKSEEEQTKWCGKIEDEDLQAYCTSL